MITYYILVVVQIEIGPQIFVDIFTSILVDEFVLVA